jgi:hypothetical protein
VFPARSRGDDLLVREAEAPSQAPSRQPTASREGVCERPSALEADEDRRKPIKRPAPPTNRLVAQLNERWRVVADPLQWILQRKKGNPRKKNSGWRGRSFCKMRDALLRCVREYCCSPDEGALRSIREHRGVDDAALQRICALPDWHPDWDRRNGPRNLDVLGTDQGHAELQATPLLSQALEAPDADE